MVINHEFVTLKFILINKGELNRKILNLFSG